MLALTSYIYTTIGFYYTQQSTYHQLLGWLERHHFPLVSSSSSARRLHNQIYTCAEIVSPTPFLFLHTHGLFPMFNNYSLGS